MCHRAQFNTITGRCLHVLEGHEQEISKVMFNPQGTLLVTASNDMTARVWDVAGGFCLQVLAGHTDEIFGCAINYNGNTIITGVVSLARDCNTRPSHHARMAASKDNTCRVWRNAEAADGDQQEAGAAAAAGGGADILQLDGGDDT
jgi:dynein assembly factor with WDR repeat domains 1